MKKFLGIVLGLILFVFAYEYLVFSKGLYFSFLPIEEKEPIFKVEDKQIVHKEKDTYTPFIAKGVKLLPSNPGSLDTHYAIDEKTYLSYLKDIGSMGANVVYVDAIMDADFYNAFYKYNQNRKTPLYLMQGISIGDYAQNNRKDAMSDEFIGTLKKDVKSAVDIVHGRKNITLNRGHGLGRYRHDVSQWVMGFICGEDWNASTIAYTNHQYPNKKYEGTYFSTKEKASAFEAIMAEIMDDFITYENRKYGQQHLVSFGSSPLLDPFQYNEDYIQQSGKIVSLDLENIQSGKELRSGSFASYRMMGFTGDTISFLEEKQKQELQVHLENLDTDGYGEGYIQLLTRYHSQPLLISSYGYSTARGIVSDEGVRLEEKKQGQKLLETYNSFIHSGASGANISSWQDAWGMRTWNTSFAIDVEQYENWNDVQSNNQGYGLMSFDTSREQKARVDNDINEWKKSQRIDSENGNELYVDSDEKYLYLMAKTKNSENKQWNFAFDITKNSGSKKVKDTELFFNKEVDFVLKIENEKAEFKVQEYYDAFRANYLNEISGMDPFVEIPSKNGDAFLESQLIVSRSKLLHDYLNILPQDRRQGSTFTGEFIEGNANPTSKSYNSQADYCISDNRIEVRIPWQLLNISNPSKGKVHDDYYKHYGVQSLERKEIYIGFSSGDKKQIRLKEYLLPSWEKVTTKIRKKTSYDILKEAWEGEDK